MAYFGLYIDFTRAVADVIQEIGHATNGESVSVIVLIWGIVKIVVTVFFGWLSFYIFFVPSAIILGWKKSKR